MKRSLATAGAVLVLTLASALPAFAAKPVRGCPNGGFALMTYEQFRQASRDVGVPEDLLGADHLAGWMVLDGNDDLKACVKDLPDTPGTLGGWIFNVVDNRSNH